MGQKYGFDKELAYPVLSILSGGALGGYAGDKICDICNTSVKIPLLELPQEANCMYIGAVLGMLTISGCLWLYKKARNR